jgi:hypothetical protein
MTPQQGAKALRQGRADPACPPSLRAGAPAAGTIQFSSRLGSACRGCLRSEGGDLSLGPLESVDGALVDLTTAAGGGGAAGPGVRRGTALRAGRRRPARERSEIRLRHLSRDALPLALLTRREELVVFEEVATSRELTPHGPPSPPVTSTRPDYLRIYRSARSEHTPFRLPLLACPRAVDRSRSDRPHSARVRLVSLHLSLSLSLSDSPLLSDSLFSPAKSCAVAVVASGPGRSRAARRAAR